METEKINIVEKHFGNVILNLKGSKISYPNKKLNFFKNRSTLLVGHLADIFPSIFLSLLFLSFLKPQLNKSNNTKNTYEIIVQLKLLCEKKLQFFKFLSFRHFSKQLSSCVKIFHTNPEISSKKNDNRATATELT